MIRKKPKAIALLFLLLPFTAFSQTLESIVEEFEEGQVPELDELLASLVKEPIAINKIPADSLASLWFLNAEQLDALVSLHKSASPNISILQISEAIDLPTEIVRILFSVDRPFKLNRAFRSRSIQKVDGWQQSLRIDLAAQSFSIGLLSEKDPGEARFDDFAAGYIAFSPFGNNTQIIIGNFSVQSGAGLVFAGTFGLPVLSQPRRAVSNMPTRILPFRTTSENIAFRGGVFMHTFPKFQIAIMQSNARRDARITKKKDVSSRPVDGLHVTEGQRAARNMLGESSTGAILAFLPNSNLRIGVNILAQRFSHSIFPEDTIRQRFAFRGNSNTLAGANIYYKTPDQHFSIIAETAMANTGKASVIGLNIRFDKIWLASGFWIADPDFHNTYGALPGNRVGETANQRAFYTGIENQSIIGRILLYTIHRSMPWRSFSYPQPVSQEDFGLQWERRIGRSKALLVNFRYRARPNFVFTHATSQQPAGDIGSEKKHFSWRLQLRTRLHKGVNYRVRFDGTALTGSDLKEDGTSQMHELSFRNANMSLGFRYSYFSTESFASRIYQFEYMLPGLLLPSALFGTGERILAYFRWSFLNHYKISSYLRYTNKFKIEKDLNFGLQFELF